MTTPGYLGIDIGTQGLSALFTDQDLRVIATGEAGYEMVPRLPAGHYEQQPDDWVTAAQNAMQDLRTKLQTLGIQPQIQSIGISGQMHAEVLADADGKLLAPARLWCDARNEEEGTELTQLFGVKMPKRITGSRWLWSIRNRPELAASVVHMTTPAGWLAYRLTGGWSLGVGEASGMFPIDQTTLNYREDLLDSFSTLTRCANIKSLRELLPCVLPAGEDAGSLHEQGAALLGLSAGIPVAPAEGDQPAALAGSLIGDAGLVSMSFGTSVCVNSVGDRQFQGVATNIDHFCAADGKPINMVYLRNGTTFMNTIVEMIAATTGMDRGQGFAQIMPQVVAAPPDCGGILAIPFMDDEPGLGVQQGGTAGFVGINPTNATAGNLVKSAVLSTIFNAKIGCELLDAQQFPRTQIVLSGGLTKTPELAQVIADVFATPVVLLASAEEGTAWGAAILAKYRHQPVGDWSSFLRSYQTSDQVSFKPNKTATAQYADQYAKYKQLIHA